VVSGEPADTDGDGVCIAADAGEVLAIAHDRREPSTHLPKMFEAGRATLLER
jgi:hypothetical protein